MKQHPSKADKLYSAFLERARRALTSALYICGLLESPALRYILMHVCGLYRHRSLD
jgi:hypothetical protein